MSRHQSHQQPGRVCRLAAFAALLAVSMWPALVSAPSATAAEAATPAAPALSALTSARVTIADPAPVTEPVTVSLTRITPTTAVPRVPVTITGTVRNSGLVPVASPVVRALVGQLPLTSRGAVSGWAVSTDAQPVAQMTEVARISLGKTLARGTVTRFALTIPATAISRRDSFAVLPLRVDVVGTTPATINLQMVLGSERTFLPTLSSVKAYEPVSIAWLVPLTLDPDPALHGVNSDARTAAWAGAIGPGSRLDRLITGTERAKVTWVIDPAVLGPPQTAEPVDLLTAPSPTPSASNTPAPGKTTGGTPTGGGTTLVDPVTEVTQKLASRLKAAAPRHTIWSLPYADPDIAALLSLPSGDRALTKLVGHPSTLDVAVAPARTDFAWPVDGTLTAEREAHLRRAVSSQGLTAAVVSASTLTSAIGPTGDASRKSSGGMALLAYDEELSRTFTQTSSAASGTTTIQRFLADSMALLGERPGTPNRSVLVAAPRTFAGDPAVLGSFFTAIAGAPWLSPTTTEELITASEAAPKSPFVEKAGSAGEESPPASPTPSPSPSPSGPDPLNPGTSTLTSARIRAIPGTLSAITGIASIRDDARPFEARWTDAQDQLLSARWRGHPAGPAAIEAATRNAITTVSRGVRVVPSSVNFFADKGVLQVTVVNDLAVPVHDVHLTLTPAQPRLVIEQQPGLLRIGANSRTNVRLEVTAVAAGLVPIEAVLTTPNGTPLGQNARVNVRVQPTSTWIYWVLVPVAGIALVLGTYRSLRRGSTRASRPAAQEPPFDD